MTTPSAPFLPVIDLTLVPRPVTVNNLAGGSGLLATTIGLITAIIVSGTVTTVATRISVHDGQDSSGRVLAILAAPAGQSASAAIPLPGMLVERGIFVSVDAGFAAVSITYVPLLDHP